MRIVTAADANYFRPLLKQIVTAKQHLGGIPAVFDLGLTSVQLDTLYMMGVQLWECPAHPVPGPKYPSGYTPRALHKPAMLSLFCQAQAENVLYMDADAWVVQPFICPTPGIGLIPVRDVVMESYRETPMEEYVGPYHSGVIFLGIGRDELLFKWEMDLVMSENPSDKKSLNRVARDFEITDLDEYEYNSRSMLPRTKIYHSQGPIRRWA